MYTERDREQIHADMIAAVRDDVDKREGSVVHDMLMPPAEEIELLGFALEAILENGFIDTAQAEYVDKRANELGIYRKLARKSTGVLAFSGRTGTEIPIGTVVMAGSTALQTTGYAVIPEEGTIDVAAEAIEGGSAGDVPLDTPLEVVDLPEVLAAVQTAFTGGLDEETDESVKERYLLKVRKPITSGNVYHYELWAREVEGIAQARVKPLHAGPGTVKVVVINTEGRAPTTGHVEAVAAHIEIQRPIGATVTVVPINEVPVNIGATLTLAGDMTAADVIDAVKASISDYLAEAQTTVRYSQIARAVLRTEGVKDYDGLTLNGGTANVVIEEDDVAVVGEVTLL